MQFPKGSGRSITAAYVSDMYRKGFRIGNCHQQFWQAIEGGATSLDVSPVIGMKHFTKAVEMALTSLAVSETISPADDVSWWRGVLNDCGYFRSLSDRNDHDKN
jgi:hypothetical protein